MINDFTPEEMALFVRRFDAMPRGRSWVRERSKLGLDVIAIVIDDDAAPAIKLAKMENGRYAATGLGGWSMTMAEDWEGLLDTAAQAIARKRSRAADWRGRSAA